MKSNFILYYGVLFGLMAGYIASLILTYLEEKDLIAWPLLYLFLYFSLTFLFIFKVNKKALLVETMPIIVMNVFITCTSIVLTILSFGNFLLTKDVGFIGLGLGAPSLLGIMIWLKITKTKNNNH